MGSKNSFEKFPELIQKEFPSTTLGHFEYDTEGSNDESVKLLVERLHQETEDMILLCHSMGGPLAIDAAKQYQPVGAGKIRMILAFDSPFFGLNLTITRHGYQRANEHAEKLSGVVSSFWESKEVVAKSTTTTTKSSGGGWLALGAAAIIAGAAAYSHPVVKETVNRHAAKTFDKMKFLGPLWKVNDMAGRIESVQTLGILFHGLFLELEDGSRFCSLCPAQYEQLFSVHKMKGKDVIDAHMGLFTDNDPDALIRLVVSTASMIRQIL
ncbi:hypothetical protein HDV01_004016 [Terramyces sp. JEL0728]|nr:hypothetical protein HDV01_004016 [Terramyces sp. JEL0728]